MTTFLPTEKIGRVYDRIGVLQDTQAFYEDPALEVLLRVGDFEHATNVFEAGCGTGRVARRLLRKHLSADCSYVGIDVSTTMVTLAATRVAPWPLAKIIKADATTYVPEQPADRILSLFVVDLMTDDDIANVLSRAHASLSDAGLLCVGGLAQGQSGITRLISTVWSRVHDLAPSLVGGCRPGSLLRHLSTEQWRIIHASRQCSYGVCSEAVVATKA